MWAKPKKPNKTLLQSPLLHDTLKSPLLHYTLIKSVATRHPKTCYYMPPLLTLLLHDTLKPVATLHPKVCCYTAPLQSPLLHGTLTKPVATWQYFSQNFKTIYKKPNTILATIYTKPNTILATSYKKLNTICERLRKIRGALKKKIWVFLRAPLFLSKWYTVATYFLYKKIWKNKYKLHDKMLHCHWLNKENYNLSKLNLTRL